MSRLRVENPQPRHQFTPPFADTSFLRKFIAGNNSDWQGFRGFVHDAAKAHFDNDFRGRKAYLCGPPIMIEACITTLMQGRLFERDIYTEKFFSAADAQQVRSPLFKKV